MTQDSRSAFIEKTELNKHCPTQRIAASMAVSVSLVLAEIHKIPTGYFHFHFLLLLNPFPPNSGYQFVTVSLSILRANYVC